MENNCNDLDLEEKLLNNSLLFSSIRKSKTSASKIKKIRKYLDRGANINAIDANDNNNTPLHVAVMKEEPEVVSFLLNQEALVNIKNSDNQTAFDIACLLHKSTRKREDIVTILELLNQNKLTSASSQQGQIFKEGNIKSSKIIEDPKKEQTDKYDIENQPQSQVVNNSSSVINRKLDQSKNKQQQLSKQLKLKDVNKTFRYPKRTGTSGLCGQLYETKLLSLILFRALYVYKLPKFLIATNVESMGAFDDIVFRFLSNKSNKPKILFVQAKHRDNPAKDKFTIDEILKLNGDFSLHKYFESYIKISQMFVPENSDEMFRGEFKSTECEFIIYTSAFENFSKVKAVEQSEGKLYINTNEGKIFQFDYDDQDVELLKHTVAKSRAVCLAKRLSKFILINNHNNMMMDDLIKTYHVFLARHVLAVEIQNGDLQNNFHFAKFRKSLFTSADELLLTIKNTICQEKKKYVSPEEHTQIENVLLSLSFKVPVDFGNLNFCFSGSEKKKEKKLEYLCSKFKQLFENAKIAENIVMKVDDSMVGPNEIFKSTDFETYRLGGLVGNLLILDEKTKNLKFNYDLHSLSDHSLSLFEKLKSEVFIGIDISKCRFDINVYRFPRLSLVYDEYDKSLIEAFLNSLMFCTNQAKEDEVENILKREIDEYFINSKRQNDRLFSVKGDAIFLKVHDRVQKWWQQPVTASYLTESCEYFFEAEQDILNTPLLSILNFTYIKTLKKALPALEFKNSTLEVLHLNDFFASPDRIQSIITEENELSSIKIIQYLKQQNIYDYNFIDLDYVATGNYFVDVKSQVKESKINTLIVVCKSQDLVAEISLLINNFQGKIIVICNRHLAIQINGFATENIVERVDSQIGFTDLADAMQTTLLEERYVTFQGKEVPLGILFDDKSYHLINSNVLYKIINNDKIAVGTCFNNPAYDEMSDIYINAIYRHIELHPSVHETDGINILNYNELNADFTPDTRDIVLITDRNEEFNDFISKHKNCNVHWFSRWQSWFLWQKSRGSILKIVKHIKRCERYAIKFKPTTLIDLRERVVIISAEPGMGKSHLLTHLAINTKHEHPALWISKINLLDCTDELRRIKQRKNNIDLNEAVQFLFRVIGFKAYKEIKAEFEIIINEVSVVHDVISFCNNTEINLTGIHLFEVELFIHCYNNDRLVLLFDGFDEICPDFANEFMQIVNVLKKSKVVRLWISTRLYNVLHQLENTLETFSYTIASLDDRTEQINFLRKLLVRKFGAQKVYDNYSLQTKYSQDPVNEFFGLTERWVIYGFHLLHRVPLYLYMISEFYQDTNFHFSLKKKDGSYLNKLYKSFVDVKFFKIRFGEKKPLLCINDPDMRKLIDNERAAFSYVHQIMAAYVIFGHPDTSQLYDNHDINAISDLIERIKLGEEKTGIIEQIIQNKPKFSHYTFAEYFSSEFLFDKLKSFHCRSSSWMCLINLCLQFEEECLLRFFNAKVANHELIFNEIYNVDLNEMFETLLIEHLKLAKVLSNVIYHRVENIAIILLKSIKAVLTKKNLDDFMNVLTNRYSDDSICIVCNAVQKSTNVVTFIIKMIKNIDVRRLSDLFNCSELPICNPLTLAVKIRKKLSRVEGGKELLNVLLSDLTPPDLVNLYCKSFPLQEKDYLSDTYYIKEKKMIFFFMISWVRGEIDSEWFNKTVEKLNREQLMAILTPRDDENRSAAHEAASYKSYPFFDKLDSVLDINQFKEICLARNNYGFTPIQLLSHDTSNCEKLNYLISKIYEGNTTEKFVSYEEFVKHKGGSLCVSRTLHTLLKSDSLKKRNTLACNAN